MSDQFTGRWLVTEYHYDPAGAFRGIVHQTRALTPLPDGTIEVRQNCFPDSQFADAFTNQFAGEWVFAMRREGALRHYLGPDVIGQGISLGQDTIIGRGRWPRFGYDFTSYGCLISPQRQITGGAFFNQDGRAVSRIVGIGIPETADAQGQFAALDQASRPDYSAVWGGEWAIYNRDGEMQTQQSMRRCPQNGASFDVWDDGTESLVKFSSGGQHGCLHSMTETIDGTAGDRIEIYDAASQLLLGLCTWADEAQQVTDYELYRLRPEN